MVFSLLGVPVEGEPSVWFAACWLRAGIYFKMETVLAFLPFLVDWEVEIKRRNRDWLCRVCLCGETGKGEAWPEQDGELRTLWGGLGGRAARMGCFQQTSQVLKGVKSCWFGLLCHCHYLKLLLWRPHPSRLRYKKYPLYDWTNLIIFWCHVYFIHFPGQLGHFYNLAIVYSAVISVMWWLGGPQLIPRSWYGWVILKDLFLVFGRLFHTAFSGEWTSLYSCQHWNCMLSFICSFWILNHAFIYTWHGNRNRSI